MDGSGFVLLSAGAFSIVLSWLMTRAGGLTFGQGAFWFLIGLALLLLGIFAAPLVTWLSDHGLQPAEAVPLAAGGILIMAVLLHQANALCAAAQQVRHLAHEVALLRQALEEGQRFTPAAADDAGRQAEGAAADRSADTDV